MSIKKSLLKKTARLLIKSGLSGFCRIKQDGFVLRFYPSSLSRILWVEQFTGEDSRGQDRRFSRRDLRPGDIDYLYAMSRARSGVGINAVNSVRLYHSTVIAGYILDLAEKGRYDASWT